MLAEREFLQLAQRFYGDQHGEALIALIGVHHQIRATGDQLRPRVSQKQGEGLVERGRPQEQLARCAAFGGAERSRARAQLDQARIGSGGSRQRAGNIRNRAIARAAAQGCR